MTLCVCGHPRERHHQYDAGWYCEGGCACDWYRKAADTGESHESTAALSAGVTPEGLAEATVAESVNEADEARAGQVRAEVAYEMKVFLHGAKMAPPVAPGWLAQIEKWYAALSQPSPDDSGGDDAWWESDDPDWQEDNYG